MTDRAHKSELGSKIGISIRAKLLLLAGVLLSALVGSSLYMRAELAAGSDAIQSQGEVLATLNTTTAALREFGEMKYWLADLQASWLNESEENAEAAKERLFVGLAKIASYAPDEVAKIKTHVEKLAERSLSAVDAFTEENRVLGNSRLAKARGDIRAVDKLLVGIADRVREGAETAKASAITGADRAIELSLIVMIVTSAIATLLTWLTVRAVINPIKRMVIAMTEIASGNRDIDLPAISKDEIGEMTKAVQVFKDNAVEMERLEAEQKESENRAEERAEREKRELMNKMAADFEASVSGVVESVSSASTEMRSSAQAMVATADETNRQSTSVAAASEQATTNVQTVAAAAEELSASIGEIGRQAARSVEIAVGASEQAEHTNARIQGLAQAAAKIGDVVALITDIADQTNLLALNATIEAARAGDAGKGFAVVASEVKNLANQTAKATEEIGVQIDGIQTATRDAVGAIEGIGKTIDQLNEIATSVAAAVEEQGAATQEIARNVEQAAAGTQEVTSNITGVTQAAGETGQAAGQIVEAAGEMSDQSETLRAEVDKFLRQVRAA